jgi:pimeloyl-ACP methyl ester carboxylesterase
MPAVLVHGVPDTKQLWDGVRSHLRRTDIITPALPGFASPVPAGFGGTKEAYVDWLISEVENVGEPVDLVGHDWGSLLVQRVVSLRPDLIRTWAAGGAAVDRDYVWHDMAQMWQTPEVGEQVMDAMDADALAVGLADQLGAEQAAIMASNVDATMKEYILRLYRSAASGFGDWHDAVDAIDRPGLVLWGADDQYVTAEFADRLAQRTNARLESFVGAGHWWPVTRASEVATALEALWNG